MRFPSWSATPLLALAAALVAGAGSLLAGDAAAAVCNVPGTYSTIAAAVADPTCSEIVLAAQTYPESFAVGRSLTLTGAGSAATTVRGTMTISGNGVVVALASFLLDASGNGAGLDVSAEAEVSCLDVSTRMAAGAGGAIFADGFESGDFSAWTLVVQ